MKKLILIFLAVAGLRAQEKDKILPKANEKFANKEYADAEAQYRVAEFKNPSATASYNLGNSIYRQNQHLEARNSYLKAIKSAQGRDEKHRAFHNLGNVLMKEKDYSGAVEAYKNALRNNPSDDETRYNYALAKKMLKDNPPKDDKKDKKKDKKDNKEKKDDQKQEKKDDPKDQGQDQKNDQGKDKPEPKEGPEGPEEKPKPGGMPKERLENLLDAVNNEERKVQGKVNEKKAKAQPRRNEKDW